MKIGTFASLLLIADVFATMICLMPENQIWQLKPPQKKKKLLLCQGYISQIYLVTALKAYKVSTVNRTFSAAAYILCN